MIAFLAPGQGMERVGMGLDVAAAWPEAAEMMEIAREAAGLEHTWRNVGRAFTRTEVAQPALVAVALSAARVLAAEGVTPDVVAGHSIGELAAWSVAGGARPTDTLRLAAQRGRAMAEAARISPGAMCAVRSAEIGDVQLPRGVVEAVENPGQRVFSGPVAAIRALGVGTPVATSGAWHSPAMESAKPAFETALASVRPQPLSCPLISNRDGALVADDKAARLHLVEQLTSPVRWTACLSTLAAMGVTEIVLLGPGKILAQHCRVALPGLRIHRTDRASDIRSAVMWLT